MNPVPTVIAAALPFAILGAAIVMTAPASAAIAPSADQQKTRPAASRQAAREQKVAQIYGRPVFFENCWWRGYPAKERQGDRYVRTTRWVKISCPDLNNFRASDIRRPGPFAKNKRRR